MMASHFSVLSVRPLEVAHIGDLLLALWDTGGKGTDRQTDTEATGTGF